MRPSHATGTTADPIGESGLFDRIVVGVDETPESLVAAAQARVLRAPGGHLAIVAVAETYLAAQAGLAAPVAEDAVTSDTAVALELACELAEPDERRLTSGRLVDVLRQECGRGDATLVVVGARPHRRLTAAVFGGHDVEFLHDAACGVLVARPGWGPSKPGRIVVGVDGSAAARSAESVARALAARLACELVPVVPLGSHPDAALLRAERDDAVLDPGGVVEAVAHASRESSLIVTGRGANAERIAYATRCSVLLVPGAV